MLRRIFIFLALTFSFFYFSVAAPPVVDCKFLRKASFIFDLEWSATPANVPVITITYDELARYSSLEIEMQAPDIVDPPLQHSDGTRDEEENDVETRGAVFGVFCFVPSY